MTGKLQTTPYSSPAKLNLFLHIVGRRDDGYHLLQSVFTIIDLCDEITFTPRDDDQITLTCSDPALATDDNLILRAGRLLRGYASRNDEKGHASRHDHYGVTIHLNKRIPMGAGLGGGSSNAATTLKVLNDYWGLHLDKKTLMELGVQLGADVPIFIENQACFAEGIGEILTPITLPRQAYVLIYPGVHVSTPKLFASPHLTRNTKPITIADYQSGVATHNDFQPLVLDMYPAVREAFELLKPLGTPRLTGSGSCVFVPCESIEKAQDFIGQIKKPMVGFAAYDATTIGV